MLTWTSKDLERIAEKINTLDLERARESFPLTGTCAVTSEPLLHIKLTFLRVPERTDQKKKSDLTQEHLDIARHVLMEIIKRHKLKSHSTRIKDNWLACVLTPQAFASF